MASAAVILTAWIKLFRFNRTIMVASITGTGAFISGAGARQALLMTLTGWLLAVGGFSMDFFADRHLDRTGPRALHRLNPLADESISPRTGLFFSLTFLALSLLACFKISAASLPFWLLVVTIITALAIDLFQSALSRCFALGMLQALYLLMGAASGGFTPATWLVAATFFFAMFGGRAMTDIRDFMQDSSTPVATLPKKIGVKKAAWFTAVNLFISFALSLAVAFTGEFNAAYLVLDIIFIAGGTACAVLFVMYPTARMAQIFTYVSMIGLGSLLCIALILGSR